MSKQIIIKYQWNNKQHAAALRNLLNLKKLVKRGEMWFLNVENCRTKERHQVGTKLIDEMIERVKEMRKITEEL